MFPEDGIYGMKIKNRKHLAPYLEYIPDPLQESWNPCVEPGRHADTNIQHRLSCLARNNSLYLVANMGDKQPCSLVIDPHCPSDGHYQYNTDVVYDPYGTLVAKYHKIHLFYEPQFDEPQKVDFVYFDTPFGRFGVFTCFDIMFREPPITLIERYGVGSVVFPTAWMDSLPLLAAVQFHSSFAVKMGVNFLAANIHLPVNRFHGSGIYTPDTNAVYYYNNSLMSEGRLLISKINVVSKNLFLIKKFPPNVGNNSSAPPSCMAAPPKYNTAPPRDKEAPPKDTTAPPSINIYPIKQTTHFKSNVCHDLFNFVLVEGPQGSLSVCYNKLCCHLEFENDDDDVDNDDMYAFGAFDDLHTYQGRYYLQVCSLLRCANSSKESCGSPVQQAQTRFRYIRMSGTFGTPYVFPAILLTDSGQLRLAPKRWTFNDLVLETSESLEFPLLSANLFGRIYGRDDDVSDDVSDDTISSVSVTTDCQLNVLLINVALLASTIAVME